jgi:hypothetical protein
VSDLERYLAPPPVDTGDPLVAELRRRQQQAAALGVVRDGNPDTAGKANELARTFNVPPETVERNLPQFQAADQQRQAVEMMRTYPAIGKWAADPRHAAVGKDDVPHLARISSAFHAYDEQRAAVAASRAATYRARFGDLTAPSAPAPTVGNFFRGIASDFVQGINEMRSGTRLAFGDLVGDMFSPAPARGTPVVSDYGREHEIAAYNLAEATTRQNQPGFKSWYMQGIYSGVSSLAQILPATAVSVLTSNPAPVLGYAGLSQGLPSYAKYRSRGGTPRQAALGSSAEGTVEVLTESLPMRYVVGRFGKAGFGEFMAGLIGREVPSEQVATHVEDAVDAAIANPDMTLGDYVRSRPSAVAQTLVATLTQSLLLGGPSELVHHMNRQGQADDAGNDAALLDDLGTLAAESKTRTRDPEAFRRFIEEHSAGSPVENIYIPGEKLRELQQSAPMDDQGFFGSYASQIDEAAASGGDVVIPLSEAAAHLAGTPAWDAIKADARLSPGGMSLNEAKSFEDAKADEMKAMSETMATEANAEQAATEPRQKLAETVRDKLMHAGFRPDVASAYAELWAARYATRAQRMGQELTGSEADHVEVRASDEAPPAEGSLNQSFNEGSRGRITFNTDGGSVIDLFGGRDLSTFVHESGHHFLEELKADAESMTSPEVFADYEAVKAWFKREGIEIGKDGTIPTEAHELWARGFERFAMEGKAPSSALRRAFDAFRSWLLTIYKVVDNLRSPVSDEVRGVMQRLIATDEEIASAAEEQNIHALFTTAEQAGMTEPEFAAYRQATSEARDEAYDALLYRTMAAIRQRKTKAWKEEEASVRTDVTKAVDAQPVFKALRLLTSGTEAGEKMKLDRTWLTVTFGPDVLNQLPKRVPPIHSDKRATHADTIAEMAGFPSGDEMVRTLIGLQQQTTELKGRGEKRSVRQIQIDEATQQEMLARHGDILNNGSIEDEARTLIHSDKQGEVIASEIRALARRANKKPTPYSIAREWAKNKIAGSTVAEALSGTALQRYERAARNAAKEAEKAMLEGDVSVTYRQKQIQMLNNALISEAKKAKDAVEAAASRLGKLAKRKTIESIDQDYLDQVHQLLEQVEFRQRSQVSIDRQTSFEAWAKDQEAQGHDVVVPASFAASLGSTHWTRLTVEQMLGLDDTVKQIVHLGRLKQKLIDGKEERDFEAVIGEALMAASNLPPKPPSDLMEPSFGDRLKANVAGFDAALLKMETVIDWLDSKQSEGVFNRIVFKPIAEAQARAGDMFADYMAKLNEALAKVPKETLRRWGDRVTARVAERGNRQSLRLHPPAADLDGAQHGQRGQCPAPRRWLSAGRRLGSPKSSTAS